MLYSDQMHGLLGACTAEVRANMNVLRAFNGESPSARSLP
jgi:hypothetical protein